MKTWKTLTLIGLLSISAACTKSSGQVAAVTPQEAAGLLRNEFAVLVDVREESEVKEGMAAQAQWIPTSQIKAGDPAWQEFKAKLPKDKQIVFYCASGGRAGKAAEELASLGYRTGNMGGYDGWVKAGLPTKKP